MLFRIKKLDLIDLFLEVKRSTFANMIWAEE